MVDHNRAGGLRLRETLAVSMNCRRLESALGRQTVAPLFPRGHHHSGRLEILESSVRIKLEMSIVLNCHGERSRLDSAFLATTSDVDGGKLISRVDPHFNGESIPTARGSIACTVNRGPRGDNHCNRVDLWLEAP